jgi:anti-sigma B factor antagonist
MEGIQVSVSNTGPNDQVSVIKVGGYIDTTTSAEVERALDSILRDGKNNIVIDLGNVDYISSAGWGIFISEIKGIRERGGDLKLVNMIPDVYEVFELLEFHYILKAFDTQEEAINDFEQSSLRSSGESVLDKPDDVYEDDGVKETTPKTITETKTVPPQVVADQGPRSVKEKIKQIIMEKPDSSVFDIKKSLNSESYNFTKVGFFSIWNQLNKMGLSSKKKRMEYFKKNAFQN